MSQVHPCARTTPRTRAEINASPAGATALACRYNITVATARKWKELEDSQDRSHRPHTLNTTLTPAQELLVVELRRMVLLPWMTCWQSPVNSSIRLFPGRAWIVACAAMGSPT